MVGQKTPLLTGIFNVRSIAMSRFIEDIKKLRFRGHIFVTSLAHLSNQSQSVEVMIKMAFLFVLASAGKAS